MKEEDLDINLFDYLDNGILLSKHKLLSWTLFLQMFHLKLH